MASMKYAGLRHCLSCLYRYQCERTIKSIMREGCNLYLGDDKIVADGDD